MQSEISRDRWKHFCDQFTKQHQGWIVNVSVGGESIAPEAETADAEDHMRPLTRSTVFQGIAAEEHDGRWTISVIAGVPPGEVNHFIYDPVHVHFRQTEEGAHEGLVIENSSGDVTLLRFRAAALPEILDGITECELMPAVGAAG